MRTCSCTINCSIWALICTVRIQTMNMHNTRVILLSALGHGFLPTFGYIPISTCVMWLGFFAFSVCFPVPLWSLCSIHSLVSAGLSGPNLKKPLFLFCLLSLSNNQPCAKSVPLVFTRASHLPSASLLPFLKACFSLSNSFDFLRSGSPMRFRLGTYWVLYCPSRAVLR